MRNHPSASISTNGRHSIVHKPYFDTPVGDDDG